MKLWHKVTIGLVAGVIFGIAKPEWVSYTKPLGDIFITLIKMIIIPLIYFSLIAGMTSITDSKSLGRIGVKSCVAYLLTTAFAIVIGLSTGLLLQPGLGVDLHFDTQTVVPQQISIAKILMDVIPDNAIGAMAQGKLVQVVFFAIFTGICLNLMGKDAEPIVNLCRHIAQLVFKMISLIIELSPYGAFALTAWVIGTQGVDVIFSLGKLVMCVLIAMTLQYIIFGLLIMIFARLSPLPFYRKSVEYQTLAFSTSSSKATLATTMKVCRDKLGISEASTSFVLPLGAAINMDGMAIYLGMCAVFFAQALDVTLYVHDYFLIILTATIGSIGAAGVPGGSMVMLPIILSAINMPIEGVALIAGIDRILDMLRTTVNITGDSTITLIIDKTEGKLNEKTYFS